MSKKKAKPGNVKKPAKVSAGKARRREKKAVIKKAVKAGAARAKGPRQGIIPGTRGPGIAALNTCCENIETFRETKNKAIADEKQEIVDAQALMHKHKLSSYRGGRVELAIVPGAEVMRVRVVKTSAIGEGEAAGGTAEELPEAGDGNEEPAAGDAGDAEQQSQDA